MSVHVSEGSHKFPRQQRLKKKKLIEALFKQGKQVRLYPILFFHYPCTDESIRQYQVLFSVSKKLFRKAVDRNKIKRRLREAYRRNKYLIEDNSMSEVPFLLGYVYISRNILPYKDIEKQVQASFDIIKQSI